ALLLLGAVAAACLLAPLDTLGVEGAADDLVAHTRQVLHTTAADQDHRVLLEVVPLARDVGGDLDRGGEAHTSDLPKRGVRLLRRGRVDAGADTAALGAALERGRLAPHRPVVAALTDQLLNGWHNRLSLWLDGRGVHRRPVETNIADVELGFSQLGQESCCPSPEPLGRACRFP